LPLAAKRLPFILKQHMLIAIGEAEAGNAGEHPAKE
jgi:hypothetical protein